jgi:hypothetical protein
MSTQASVAAPGKATPMTMVCFRGGTLAAVPVAGVVAGRVALV